MRAPLSIIPVALICLVGIAAAEGPNAILTLKPDGFVSHPEWDANNKVARWEAFDRRTVITIGKNGIAALQFAEDLESFTGYDVSGNKLNPV